MAFRSHVFRLIAAQEGARACITDTDDVDLTTGDDEESPFEGSQIPTRRSSHQSHSTTTMKPPGKRFHQSPPQSAVAVRWLTKTKMKTQAVFAYPPEPLALMIDVTKPRHPYVMPEKETRPNLEYYHAFRTEARNALARGTALPIPSARISPFLQKLKGSLKEFDKITKRREHREAGSPPQLLLRARDAHIWHRDADQQAQHEDNTRRYAGHIVYFQSGQIASEHQKLLHRKGERQVSDHKTAWRKKYMDWTRSTQHAILQLFKDAIESLTALYTWDVLSRCTQAQMNEIFEGIFMKHELAHAMAMFSRCAGSVDFEGIFLKSTIPAEEEYRKKFRRAIKFRFIKACQWTWTYRVNVDQELERYYKETAFEKWRNLVTDNEEYQKVLEGFNNVDSVPTPSDTDQAQNNDGLFKS
ncbi:uncharacterized protein AB675_104 [Cyphellophora attinorum]|uniref:Uncharacterized protein n=1 Tax=Cyphellophora attinorum TaxID=1664694 RepID=A0A0N1H6F0_9EURO|nr:uncharacterized protein AB675_104 [Phialophora attinorum]KPI37747.1 hypothetical protein AB675_104 [Phialophora attinorum]